MAQHYKEYAAGPQECVEDTRQNSARRNRAVQSSRKQESSWNTGDGISVLTILE